MKTGLLVQKNKLMLLILMTGLLAAFLCCCAQAEGRTEPPVSEDISASRAAEARTATGLRFVYDKNSGEQRYLNAYVEGMSEDGAKVTLIKRVGPMNYTGHKREGEFALSGQQVARLWEILGSYDLEAWSKLPSRTSTASALRSLIVFRGEETLYNVMWNAKLPKTLPPQEDIMYFELYNFFNDLVASEPGWEDVVSENLEDPRDNPAYYERTVTWFGNEVRLVPGTGIYYEDGRYAEIDYQGRDWWIVEGFTGQWTLDIGEPSVSAFYAPKNASLTVHDDGTLQLILDDEVWSGHVSGLRRYMDSFGITLEKEDGQWRSCEVSTWGRESYDRIHISYQSNPYPEPQYPPIDVFLVRQ